MTARTTQPRLSKGPLGERGRRLQERLGVVPLAAITRRGAVPVWLRASWSGPLAAAKAASQPANCRRHEGWSRSPSPCTRWGTRLLICARFQPDWGKPNVRLIGGGRKPAPVGSAVRRAAPPAYPTMLLCGWTLRCQWFGQRRVRGQARGVGQGGSRARSRDRAQARRAAHLRGAAQTLGGRANAGVDHEMPAARS